jgi:hypothetical protein
MNSVDGIQVITPIHWGIAGMANLNSELQRLHYFVE